MNIKNKEAGVIIMSTFPDEKSCMSVAEGLIKKKLCACVNLTKVRSLYTWNNKFEDQEEYLALFKSTASTSKELKSNIERAHPYKIPEIVELKMNKVSRGYMSWLAESTNEKEKNKNRLRRSRKS